MDTYEVIRILIQWVLGLLTVAIIGIVAMHVRISVYAQRLLDHMVNCDKLHDQHNKAIEQLWTVVRGRHD